MKKTLRYLNRINLIPYIFLAFFTKMTIYGAGIGDAIAALAICGLVGYQMFLRHRLDSVSVRHLSKQVSEMKSLMSAVQVKNNIRKEDLKNKRLF